MQLKRTDVNGLVEYLDRTGSKMSKSFIYRLVKENRIPHIRIGTKIIFDIGHIEDWLSPQGDIENKDK